MSCKTLACFIPGRIVSFKMAFEQQWRALSMARQEGEGEETSLKR